MPVTAVAFHDSAPLAGFQFLMKRTNEDDGGHWYMDCSKVETTDFGMLLLVPSHESFSDMAVYVHPSHILWMLRAVDRKKVGFLA